MSKPTKAKCKSCGELLHNLVYKEGILGEGTKSSVKQCINHKCKKYGKPV